MTAVRILGIDPGSRQTGYGIIESIGQRNLHVAHGRIRSTDGDMAQRLLAIFTGLEEIIREFMPAEIAVEETFVNRVNASSALVLGQARGVAVCAAARSGVPVAEYAATQVKLAVTGTGRAEKQQVQHMVRAMLKLQGVLTADASDALAVALTHAHVRGTRQRSGYALDKAWG